MKKSTRGGLIEEQYGWIDQELVADAYALPLPATDPLPEESACASTNEASGQKT